MKQLLKRLRKEERGNVLYMTIVMMMLLVMFSLVLTNVIYIGVMKVRAQNAADNIALSAATLKARMLNGITNWNAVLWLGVRQVGVISEKNGYKTPPELAVAIAAMVGASANHLGGLYDFNDKITGRKWIDRIAEANGIDGKNSRYEMFPVSAGHMLTSLYYDIKVVPFMVYAVPVLFSIEPTHTWYVQSRVELQIAKSIIGGKRLGFELPDITARARAEILDKATLNVIGSGGRDWQVVLAPPNKSVDKYMRDQTGSRNSGGDVNRQILPENASITPAPLTGQPPLYQSSEDYLESLPGNVQYAYYKERYQAGAATLKEKIRYYDLKQTYGNGLSWLDRADRQRCRRQLNQEEQL
ncbi:Tad domain-containing protein [bacterium]|nr:Tad domain-containing protein [bacterium]